MHAQIQSPMTAATKSSPLRMPHRHLPGRQLQGGGALGDCRFGALSEAGIHPNWIAGMSIGAINAAIIAGNPPNSRIERLREFWTQVTADGPWFGAACMGLAMA